MARKYLEKFGDALVENFINLGVPHNGFLVAASFDPEHYGKTPMAEREVILLRVIGSSRLPQDDELVQTRVRAADAGRVDVEIGRVLDPVTDRDLECVGSS